MLDKVKKALRITHVLFDDELTDLINACYLDLQLAGITNVSPTDALIIQAVTTYCKANFGIGNEDSERFKRSYDLLKQSLSLSTEYGESNV